MPSKMTLGPWTHDESRKYYDARVIRHNGQIICNMSTQGTGYDESLANARAIACLPELVEAARKAEDTLQWASGAFQSVEESAAWIKLGRPVLENLTSILASIVGETGGDK